MKKNFAILRRMKTKHFIFLGLCFFGILSCNKNVTGNNTQEKQIVTAALGAEPSILDAAKASDRYSFVILDYINENLSNIETEIDGTQHILPGIAESWRHNEDFTEWVFNLRDAYWSDGKKITADDFVYSIKRIFNKESASPMAMYYDYIKNAKAILKDAADYNELGIIAVDEKTLKILTEDPIKNLDEFAAKIPPQREDIINQFKEGYGSDAEKIICSGPFKVKSWTHNSKIELVKNEYFWNAKEVKLDELNFKIINEQDAMLGELLTGSIDIAKATSIEWINRLKKEDKFNLINGLDSRVQYMFINTRDELFSNKKIRQAVSISLDREEISNDLFDGIYKPAYGFVSISTNLEGKNYRSLAGEPIKKLIQSNPNPKELFIEGLKELGLSEDTSKITISIIYPSNERSKFDEYLQQTLQKKLGVNIILDRVERTVFKKRNRSLEYQIGFKSWAGGIDTPARYLDLFLPGNKIVPIGWENSEYIELVTKAKKSTDFNEKLEAFKRAEEILLAEEACIVPYTNQTYNIFMQKKLHNVKQFYPGTYNLKYAEIK